MVLEQLERRIVLASTVATLNVQVYESDRPVIDVNGTLFFSSYTPDQGWELWRSDGTVAGTRLVKDLAPGSFSSTPFQLTSHNGLLYFACFNMDGVFRSDGTPEGTYSIGNYNASEIVSAGTKLYFAADDPNYGEELFVSDGNPGGSFRVSDIVPGSRGSNIGFMYGYEGNCYFQAWGSTTGGELGFSNGTVAGTGLIKDIYPGISNGYPNNFVGAGGKVYFNARDSEDNDELWVTDGTPGGTKVAKETIAGSTGSGITPKLVLGNTLYSITISSDVVQELWKTDLATGTTSLVKKVSDTATTYTFYLTAFNGKIYFEAHDSTHGGELWRSDGTAAGTGFFVELNPGLPNGVAPNRPAVSGGNMFFRGNDGTTGLELWTTDGTAAGTSRLTDLNPGSLNANPRNLTVSGGKVFFVADSSAGAKLLHVVTQDAPARASLRGTLFDDADGDGVRDAGEVGLAGRAVFLDTDGDGSLDAGETSVTANAGGEYTFGDLLPGSYLVRTVLPAGWQQTAPAAGAGRAVTLVAGQSLAGQDFGTRATSGQAVTLRANADAYVRDGSSAGQNFGSATELQLKKSSSAGSTREVYLKFDLSNVASVQNAKLRLNGKIDSSTQSPQVGVFTVGNTSWVENTINWNNRPPTGANGTNPMLASAVVSGSTAKWYEFDVTSYLAAEKAAGRNLVTLAVRSLTNTDPYLIFASDEGSANSPELVVTPNGGTPPPPPQEIVVSANAVSVPEASQSSFTVRLASQPASDVVVTVARASGDTDLSVAPPSTLLFTAANWSTPQAVWIAGAEDADSLNGSASFAVSATGLTSKSVTATEVDNDPAGPQPLTVRAAADAYLRDGTYAGQNFGGETQLIVKRNTTSSNTRESYLRFNLNEFTGASAATLRIFAKSNNAAQGVALSLFAAENVSWSETGINWNNKPAAGTAALGTKTVNGTAGAWYEFDVTQYVQQRKAAGAAAVTFVLKAGTNTDAQAVIESDESASASSRPQLVVTPGTPPPPQQAFVVSAEQLSVPEGGTATFTVRLAAQPSGDVAVRVTRSGGDLDVTAGTVPGGENGVSLTFTAANWNVPQTVSVAAAQDADTTNGLATIRIAQVGGATVPVKEISATEVDDDAPAGPTVLRATADAYVRDGSSATRNFGAATELQLKNSGAGSNREVFFKFDLTTLTSVSTAKLRVFGRIDSSTEKPGVAVFGAADTAWTESGMNWNNRPAAGAAALAIGTVAGSTAKYYEWDVTAYLQAQKAAGATSVTLVLRSLTTTTPHMIFNSDEATANRPELVVGS